MLAQMDDLYGPDRYSGRSRAKLSTHIEWEVFLRQKHFDVVLLLQPDLLINQDIGPTQ